ncbi:MAG: HlyC/CorC family transporter [Chloroflexi bacterium]|jgi:putative hemolysin|nr:HlyC/CorC family transporter [Chloroflexota bacterium]MBT4073662.1 HlyC/CorC family transporter [Chloroflexota bacterium]MBT4514039.1 HlyC/CorC family transporter [Chloroflexota bacterium]MBT5319429.1 HlyC/CorC family transporter [Chloroflexota bacterium]MBT6681941.1 HlyC/CorC family transporter [Chloroflexota bacterium]
MTLSILIIVAAVIGSALISASEAAIISVNRFRVRHRAEQGDVSSEAIVKITDEYNKFFGTILLIGNALNIIITAVGTALVIRLWGNSAGVVAIATLGATVVVVVAAELTPKALAVVVSERWSHVVSRPVLLLMRLTGPLVWIFTLVPRVLTHALGGKDAFMTPTITEGELRMLIDVGEAEGTVEESQGEMLENIFRFGESEVRDVMTPRNEIEWVEVGTNIQGFMETYAKNPHTRFPVFDDDHDDVVGILSVKDVLQSIAEGNLQEDVPVTGLMRTTLFVPETKKQDELFQDMQETGHKISLVVDEFGGIAGLVTLTKIVEQAIGATGEEGSRPDDRFITLDANTFELDAALSIEDANDRLELGIPDGDYQTIAGFLLDRLQRLPRVGDRVRSGPVRFQVIEMMGNKIVRVRARRWVTLAEATPVL